jgi:molecular chaperone DnaK (HSP70)
MATILMLCRRPLLRKSTDLRFKLHPFLRAIANEAVLNKAQQSLQTRSSLKTSLAWVQIYHRCPSSYGVGTFEGYHEMISKESALPIEKSSILENALPYLDRAVFPVYYRQTPQDAPVLIDSVEVQGLTIAERGMADVKVTMKLNEDLMGNFTVEDMHTQKTASIEFDGKVALRTERDKIIVS